MSLVDVDIDLNDGLIENAPTSTITTELQLLYKREQEPTSATPITYREYVYALTPGTSEDTAAAVLRTQFEVIKATMAPLPTGKLVNIAAFDVVFVGKPKTQPLVTLTWKDWRGEPVMAFPRRSGPPVSMRPMSQAPQSLAAAQMQAPPPPVVIPPAPPVPVVAVLSAPPPPPMVVSAPPPPPPAPVVIASPPPPPPMVVSAPPPPPPPAPPVATGFPPPPPFVEPPPAPSAVPPPPPPPPRQVSSPRFRNPHRSEPRITGGRSAGDDLITDLFEAMHDLHFLGNALDGADFCLSLALEKLPSRAGFVHFYDINKREFVLATAKGKGANALLLDRHPETDAMLLSAMKKRRAVVVADATGTDAESVGRFAAIAGVKSLIVAPVMQAGRWLGAIELLNPLDGAPFTDGDGEALSYIGEQFAEFLSSRGVILDAEQIARAGAEAARAQ